MINEELLMELSDCGSPEGLAQIIHNYISLKDDGSTDLCAIAKALGIIEIKSTDSPAYEGLLITDTAKSNGVILYNVSSHIHRTRFTIAHELGHFLLPFHDKNAQCASSDFSAIKSNLPNQKKEAEANRFAIELLAPKKKVRSFLSSYADPDIAQLLDLHARFKISKEAAARRYIDCSDHIVAIIFGEANAVRYVMISEDFPYINLSSGEKIPEHMLHQIRRGQENDVIDWYGVDPDYFLSDPEDSFGKEFCCQTIIQNGNFHISILSFDDE